MVTQTGGLWTFHLVCPDAERVYVVGDFNDWSTTAVAMQRNAQGDWQASLKLPPGTYHFRYLVADGQWITDFAAFGVMRNRQGEWDSVLYVPQKN